MQMSLLRSMKVFLFFLLNNHGVIFWYSSCSGPVAPDRDVYYDLAKKLFGEEKLSTHPVPEYMEAREVPRYVAVQPEKMYEGSFW